MSRRVESVESSGPTTEGCPQSSIFIWRRREREGNDQKQTGAKSLPAFSAISAIWPNWAPYFQRRRSWYEDPPLKTTIKGNHHPLKGKETMVQPMATAPLSRRRRPRSVDQHTMCSNTASEASTEPTEGGVRRSVGESSRLEMGGWQEQPLSRKACHDRHARVDTANCSSSIKSIVVGIVACVLMWGALDTDSSGGGLAFLQLPVADAYELYSWDPDALSGSEDMPPDNNNDVVPLSPPVAVTEAVMAPPQGTPRNQNYHVYIDDDDNISEEDIRYDDDYVSGDATYTNEHVAGAASRGETDGGAGPSITNPNYRGVPSPRPTRNPTRRPPTPRPTRRPRPPPTPRPTRRPRPPPTPSPTVSPTAEPTDAPVPKPTKNPTPALLPTLTPTAPTASPTAPIPYTFTIQMTPFEITLTSMDGKLDGQQLQMFNLFSDKEIEQTWLSRKLGNLSEDDAKSLTDGYVDISFKSVVTSQLLSAPIVASSSTTEESFRQSDGGGATSMPPTTEDTLTIKSSKSTKGSKTPTAAPTMDLDGLVRRRRRTTTATVASQQERQRQWQREFHSQRKRALKNNDDIDHTSIAPTSATPAMEHTLYLQQTKTAFVTVRGEYLLKSQPDIIPTLSELDTAVQITYGSESPNLVTVLRDYDLEAFDELHAIDFLHFFYPSTVGGVSSIKKGKKPIQQGRTLNGGAKFGIFLATVVGSALLGLAAVRASTSGDEEEHYKSKSTSSGENSRCVLLFHFTSSVSLSSHISINTLCSQPSCHSFTSTILVSPNIQ